MNIKITADSTCDLSQALIAAREITIIPLMVNMGGSFYKDGVDLRAQDIFAYTDKTGELCTTSALNVHEYRAFFADLAPCYDAVIHISIGSGFSCCHQNALAAARDFKNVRVIDSNNLSTGQGLIVLAASDMARANDDVDAICEKLHALTKRVEASFLINRLDYMAKGGRCSSVQMLGANLLSLKPCIEVKNGWMQVAKKYRGSLERCVRAYIEDRLDARADIDTGRLFITSTPVRAAVMDAARETVRRFQDFREVLETSAGCTVSCHCGPGTLGVLFIRKEAGQ